MPSLSLVDSHAHIAEEAYDLDRDEMLARAAAAGVEDVVVIGYDAPSTARAIEVARAGGGGVRLFATGGVAPHHVLETDEAALEAVRSALAEDLVVGIGEIGLDYHYDMPPDAQRELFARQLGWARDTGLPVVIHSREAEDDVIALLMEHGARPGSRPAAVQRAGELPPLRGVIHCFTESPRMAVAAVDLGFYVSFAGIVTFKSAGALRETASRVPLDRLLIETDSPYLAPVPHRGKRNEPAHVAHVAATIAELHGVSTQEVGKITSANARRLFALPPPGG